MSETVSTTMSAAGNESIPAREVSVRLLLLVALCWLGLHCGSLQSSSLGGSTHGVSNAATGFVGAQPPLPPEPNSGDRPPGKGKPFGLRKSIRLDAEGPAVEADGYLNLHEGFVEFLACVPGAKGHETLVALQCDPLDLWLGLVVGLQLDANKAVAPDSKKDIAAIEGERVLVFLRWQEKNADGETQIVERRAEECLLNSLVEEAMDPVGWVFTGGGWVDTPAEPHHREAGRGSGKNTSKDWQPQSVLGPLLSGHIIAVSHRPHALLDHPLELPFPDGAYSANTTQLPQFDPERPVPVTLVFRRPREGEIDLTIEKMKVPDHPVDPDSVDPSKERGPEPDDL